MAGVSGTKYVSQVLGVGSSRPPARMAARRRKRNALLAALVIPSTAVALTFGSAGSAAAAPRFRMPHRRMPVPTASAPGPSSVLPSPGAPPPAPADTCAKPGWAQAVQGAPASFNAGSDAAYLWYDPDGGWALRFTHASAPDTQIFAGSLSVTSGQFLDLTSLSDRPRDIVALSPDKRTIYFRFVDFGILDGLNFATHCTKAFSVNIYEDGSLLPVGGVHLGSTAASPPSDPFKVTRGSLLSAKPNQPASKGAK